MNILLEKREMRRTKIEDVLPSGALPKILFQ